MVEVEIICNLKSLDSLSAISGVIEDQGGEVVTARVRSRHRWHHYVASGRLQPSDCVCGKADSDAVHKNYDGVEPSPLPAK